MNNMNNNRDGINGRFWCAIYVILNTHLNLRFKDMYLLPISRIGFHELVMNVISSTFRTLTYSLTLKKKKKNDEKDKM